MPTVETHQNPFSFPLRYERTIQVDLVAGIYTCPLGRAAFIHTAIAEDYDVGGFGAMAQLRITSKDGTAIVAANWDCAQAGGPNAVFAALYNQWMRSEEVLTAFGLNQSPEGAARISEYIIER